MPLMPFSRTPNWIIDTGLYAKLSPSAARLLPVLGRRLNAKDDAGSVTIDRLCELSGLKKTAVYNALSELEKHQIIEREYGKVGYRFRNGGKSDSATAERVSANTERVSATAESHPYMSRTSIKNTHQEGRVSDGTVPYPHREGGRINTREAAERLLAATGWPKVRWGGEGGVRLLQAILVRLADGWEDDTAATDPVTWIQERMARRVQDADSERFIPNFRKWVESEYPHLARNEQPV
jgi:hypothetical protein